VTPRATAGRRALRRITLVAAALLPPLLPARPARAQPTDPLPPTPVPTPIPSPEVPPPAEPATPAEEEAAAKLAKRSLADLVDVFDDKNRVPENPALDILDANSLNAVKPGGVKDLATDLRGLYVGGKLVPQIAVEVSPYALAFGRRTSYDDYRRHAYVPILHRLSVSIATTSITDGTEQATLGAVGARVRLFDRSDWRLDDGAVKCALDAVTLAKPPAQPGGAVVVPVDADASGKEALKIKECFDKARLRTGSWNASQLALGGAFSSSFPGGKLRADIRDLTGWIGWAHKLGRSSLLQQQTSQPALDAM